MPHEGLSISGTISQDEMTDESRSNMIARELEQAGANSIFRHIEGTVAEWNVSRINFGPVRHEDALKLLDSAQRGVRGQIDITEIEYGNGRIVEGDGITGSANAEALVEAEQCPPLDRIAAEILRIQGLPRTTY